MVKNDDCIQRNKYKCKKTGRNIAIDLRFQNEGKISCWERINCEHYETFKKEEEVELKEELKEGKKEEKKIGGQSSLF